LAKARQSFNDGDYRWVVEVVNHLVFADPTNDEARHLQADTFEQLGYQCESATFRNAYLNAAQELRHGPPQLLGGAGRGRGILRAMSVEQVFDAVAVRLVSENVGGMTEFVNWTFTDINENWVLGLSNRTLFHVKGRHEPRASVTVSLPRTTLIEVVTQETTFMEQIQAGNIAVDGDPAALLTIFGNLDSFTPGFHIVEP
jgi:alkyl sulfatase BDS1-like metallo-beta-lactamase superfamily hydrolase